MKTSLLSVICAVVLTFQGMAQDYKIENNELKLAQPVLFETNSYRFKPESDAALNIIKKYLTDKPYISLLRVESHTDNTGNAKANQTLSEKRAYVICAALVTMGIDCKRLLPVGFGGTKPIADNRTSEGKAANMRVVLVNAALSGHLIGSMPANGGGVVAGDICTQ